MEKNVLRQIFVFIFIGVFVCSGVTAFDFGAMQQKVAEKTLDNGLKVIVLENHDAPVVSFATVCNVGSVDDPKGYTGLAHMFEHMAFKGTQTIGSNDIEKELKLIAVEDSLFMELRSERTKGRMADSAKIERLTTEYEAAREASFELVQPNKFTEIIEREGGVGLNAGTANDWTAYVYSLPSNKVELWMALESERFFDPVLREMYKERDVVAEERRMRIESNPQGRLFEEFLGLAFKAHPYGISGIGHMSDINYYSRNEANDFFEKYYGPTNMVVVIVGDVKPKDVFKMAEKYFGRIKARPKPDRIATVEPEQLGERRMIIEDEAQPFYLAGWHIPEGTHPDRPALDALADYFGQGRTSLLYKNLVKDKKMALAVGAFNGFPGEKYPTLMAVYSLPASGRTNAECEKEIFAEIERLKEELIPAEEVEKIKARSKANFINQLQDLSGFGGMPVALGLYDMVWGSWREMFKELDRVNSVTAEEMQRVAKKYLTDKNRTVVMINTIES